MKNEAQKNKDLEFFRVLVIAQENSSTSYIKVFWSWAEHIGTAIHKVIEVAQKMGLCNPIADMIDFSDFESLPGDVYEVSETGVFTCDEAYSFPAEDSIDFPDGIILHIEDENPEDSIKEGYESYYSDNNFYCINIVLPRSRLFGIFMELVKGLSDIKVSWVSIQDENNEKAQLWVNEDLNDANKILNFLESTQVNILQNGLVGFTVYSEDGATNLNLTDHKEISVVTQNESIKELLVDQLNKLKIREFDKLSCISEGFLHWHYRPAEALNHEDFIKFLKSNGFNLWKQE